MVSNDVISMRMIPHDLLAKELPGLYGFPFINKTSGIWLNSGPREFYVIPFILDVIFYGIICTLIVYWFKPIINFNYRNYIQIISAIVLIWLAGIQIIFFENHFLLINDFDSLNFNYQFNLFGN